MANEKISPALEKFIRTSIHSIEQLEILLLLRGRAKKEWTAEEVSAVLRSRTDSVKSRLDSLVARGLLGKGVTDGSYFYYPSSRELSDLCSDLAEAYLTRRFTVINSVYSGITEPPDSIQDFSDAFKI